MKMSNMLMLTLREVPAEAEIESHKLFFYFEGRLIC